MRAAPIIAPIILAAGLLALAACGKSDDAATATATTDADKKISISIDDNPAEPARGALDLEANTETGSFELKLPGGVEANIKVPGDLARDAKFDIDGVGLYPGARIGSIKVDAQSGKADHGATVQIGFSAPADAAAVADWYEQQFAQKTVVATRSGETLSGKTGDGNDFTLALVPAAAGAQGILTIIDADRN